MHVYGIFNKISGKVYIGKSERAVGLRESDHFKFAMQGKSYCSHLYSAIRKQASTAFEVVLISGYAQSKEDLCNQEIEFISRYRAKEPEFGYNLTSGGEGADYWRGKTRSPEDKQKMRLAKLGTKQSAETIAKRAKAMVGNRRRWNRGRVQSDEERKQRSLTSPKFMLGKHHSEETKRKISESVSTAIVGEANPFYGRQHSENTKETLRKANTGRKHTQEELLKMSQGNTGKARTEETRKRMSEAAKKRGVSREHILRMVEARLVKQAVQ